MGALSDYVQIVGCDVPGSVGGAYIQTPDARILINVPEGTQRFAGDAQVKITKVGSFCFTRITSSAVMGLPGFLFTVNDTGVNAVEVCGPEPATSTFIEATQKMFFRYRKMSIVGCGSSSSSSPSGRDVVSGVAAADEGKQEEGDPKSKKMELIRKGDTTCILPILVRLPLSTTDPSSPSASSSSPPQEHDEAETIFIMCYLVTVKEARRFLPQEAKRLGVKPGPKFTALKKGTPVESDDHPRRMVSPDDVLSPESNVESGALFLDGLIDQESSGVVLAAVGQALRTHYHHHRSTSTSPQSSTSLCLAPTTTVGGEKEGPLRYPQLRIHHVFNLTPDDDDDDEGVRRKSSPSSSSSSSFIQQLDQEVRGLLAEFNGVCEYSGQKQQQGTTTTTDSGEDDHRTAIVVHVAKLNHQYSALPTALIHRHHLKMVAPELFPMRRQKSNVKEEEVRQRRMHQQLVTTITASAAGISSSSSSVRSRRYKEEDDHHSFFFSNSLWPPSVRFNLKSGSVVTDGAVTYPTELSSMLMLGEEFRRQWIVAEKAEEQNCPTAETGVNEGDEDDEVISSSRESGGRRSNDSGKDIDDNGEDNVTFLGTGSAVPSKYRNVSGFYVEHFHADGIEDGGSLCGLDQPEEGRNKKGMKRRRDVIVCDFGEGNLGQLRNVLMGCRHRGRGSSQDANELGNCDDDDDFDHHDDEEVLRRFVLDIRLIFVSHSHADHNLGLFSLLDYRHRAWQRRRLTTQEDEPKVYVVAPLDFIVFVHEAGVLPWMMKDTSSVSSVIFVPFDKTRQLPIRISLRHAPRLQTSSVSTLNPAMNEKVAELFRNNGGVQEADPQRQPLASSLFPVQVDDVRKETVGRLGWDFIIFPVDHPAHAHAMAVKNMRTEKEGTRRHPSSSSHHDGPVNWIYSGDCRPDSFLVQTCREFFNDVISLPARVGEKEIGNNCRGGIDLLIHEATFADTLAHEAVSKKHSTLSEALSIAAALNTKHVVLTHFSQRYPKIPPQHHHDDHRQLAEKNDNDGNGTVGVDRRKFCYAFDMMQLPFSALDDAPNRMDAFRALLQEYDGWGEGTSKRLRSNSTA